jgi:hypothetical protein
VALASRGLRNINDKIERITDEAELKRVRQQAQKVILKGSLAALPLTLLAYLIP